MSSWKRSNIPPVVISIFNHKGDVSKTTTTFHVGWMLANKGLKVLMVDADPQCNLTGLSLGVSDYDALFNFYQRRGNNDIYSSLAGHFGFADDKKNLDNGVATSDTKCEKLKILAGHIDFSKFELQVATALLSSGSIPLLKPLLSALHRLIRNTANKFDIVLIDMSPAISAINMCLLMSSDYFIIPTTPDFYSYQAINSLSSILPQWERDVKKFKDGNTMSEYNPKLLGIVSQNYRVYSTEKKDRDMTVEYSKWSDKIKLMNNQQLVPTLRNIDMVIDRELFEQHVSADLPYNMSNIKNFNSLVPTSQRLSRPMFDLKQEDGNWRGGVWLKKTNTGEDGVKIQIEKATEVYSQLADAVCGMTGYTLVS